ncbi:OLC1v1036280C1 [Oldenlandia corymbosa var. corymbosa]|uniref:OLC1v1036280C1 n=1 Tax=Oldenlandia corymbosa var. corymbosa TaxID=529605 RepID=A0AAV1CUZ0_OLDCO|nr:OLC1v1036280C1 [Oldenlandia corymbosa var. corymbosa]
MEIFSPVSVLLFIFLISLYFYIQGKSKQPAKSGFKIYPILGTLPEFLLNRHRFLDWSSEVLSKTPTNTSVFHRPGGVHGVLTANPENVEYMLKTNFENYPKGKRFIGLLEDFLGTGIFNSDGELWIIQRKTASYEFNTKSLRNFVMENVKFELQTRLIPLLEQASRADNVLDVQDILERFAFDNICKLAFNVDPGCLGGDATEGAEFMKAFEDAATLSSGRFMYAFPGLYLFKKFFNFGSEKQLRKSISVVHEFADTIINSRLEQRNENRDEDLLSRFIGKSDNISGEFLRDIVISFILAGRDTTSSALSWFFWLLSTRPEIEENILKELELIRNRGEKVIGDGYDLDELREMHYLHAAISESMRLYPPVPVDTKACLQEDVLPDGNYIGKDWFITYHTYAMGRMEQIWGKDCCEYRPERWLENGIYKQESPFKFPVFHGGPRMCLGKDMAYIQMKSIAASVLERFRFDVLLDNDHEKCPEHLLSLTLRMKGGLLVKMKER